MQTHITIEGLHDGTELVLPVAHVCIGRFRKGRAIRAWVGLAGASKDEEYWTISNKEFLRVAEILDPLWSSGSDSKKED
jgi:hypothetical protein